MGARLRQRYEGNASTISYVLMTAPAVTGADVVTQFSPVSVMPTGFESAAEPTRLTESTS